MCRDRSSLKRATLGARVSCDTQSGFRAFIQSWAFSAFGAAKYVMVDRQGSARSTSWKQWGRSKTLSWTWQVRNSEFYGDYNNRALGPDLVQISAAQVDEALGFGALGVVVQVQMGVGGVDQEHKVQRFPLFVLLGLLLQVTLHLDALVFLHSGLFTALAQRGVDFLGVLDFAVYSDAAVGFCDHRLHQGVAFYDLFLAVSGMFGFSIIYLHIVLHNLMMKSGKLRVSV